MKSTTRTRKTTRPISARSAISSPQLAPISDWEMSSGGRTGRLAGWCRRPRRSRRGQRLGLDQDRLVARGGDHRRGGVVDAGAGHRLAELVGGVLGDLRRPAAVTRYSAPPANSMPMLRPRKSEPAIEATHDRPRRWRTRASLRPTKSIETRPRRGRCRAVRTRPSGPPSHGDALRGPAVDAERLGATAGQPVTAVEEPEAGQPGHHRLGEPEEHHQVDQRSTGRARTRSPSRRRRRRCRAPRPRAARPRRRRDRCSGPAPSPPRRRRASTCRRASRRGCVRRRR